MYNRIDILQAIDFRQAPSETTKAVWYSRTVSTGEVVINLHEFPTNPAQYNSLDYNDEVVTVSGNGTVISVPLPPGHFQDVQRVGPWWCGLFGTKIPGAHVTCQNTANGATVAFKAPNHHGARRLVPAGVADAISLFSHDDQGIDGELFRFRYSTYSLSGKELATHVYEFPGYVVVNNIDVVASGDRRVALFRGLLKPPDWRPGLPLGGRHDAFALEFDASGKLLGTIFMAKASLYTLNGSSFPYWSHLPFSVAIADACAFVAEQRWVSDLAGQHAENRIHVAPLL